MPRELRAGGVEFWKTIKINEGGAEGQTAPVSLDNLDGVPLTSINAENGPISLNAQGHINSALIHSKYRNQVMLNGPTQIRENDTKTYQITNFDSWTNYNVSADPAHGTVVLNDETLTYTAPPIANIEGENKNITINGRVFSIFVMPLAPDRPAITAPTANSSNTANGFIMRSTAFAMEGYTETHLSSDWRISTTADMSNVILSSMNSNVNMTTWTLTGLPANTQLYAQVRHRGDNYGASAWSPILAFRTAVGAVLKPSITSPTAGQTELNLSPTFTSSAFGVNVGTNSHLNSDWQLATDTSFTNIVRFLNASTSNKTSWSVSGLDVNTLYYLRVRYRGDTYPVSEYSNAVSFRTLNGSINAPVFTAPAGNITIYTSSYLFKWNAATITPSNADTIVEYQLQSSDRSDFINPDGQPVPPNIGWFTTGTSLELHQLETGKVQYYRVRGRGSVLGWGPWSIVRSVTRSAIQIATPSITAPQNNDQVPTTGAQLNSSAFSVTAGTDTHASSSWEVATNSTFTSIFRQSLNNASNKLQWPTGSLNASTNYYCRVKHNGASGASSLYSAGVMIRAVENAVVATPTITTPSSNGTTITTSSYTFRTSNFSMQSGSGYTFQGLTYTVEGFDTFYNSWQDIYGNIETSTSFAVPISVFANSYYSSYRITVAHMARNISGGPTIQSQYSAYRTFKVNVPIVIAIPTIARVEIVALYRKTNYPEMKNTYGYRVKVITSAFNVTSGTDTLKHIGTQASKVTSSGQSLFPHMGPMPWGYNQGAYVANSNAPYSLADIDEVDASGYYCCAHSGTNGGNTVYGPVRYISNNDLVWMVPKP